MTRTFFLGIDGGATNCRARIEDADGRALGEGKSGTANPRHGQEAARAAIVEATRSALSAAGLVPEAIGELQAGLGLAGVGQPADRARLLAWEHPFASLYLLTDAHAACLGAHDGGDGAVLTLGTGSCGVAIVRGTVTQVGGWGFPISDLASGAWLGLEAIRRALLAHDRAIPGDTFFDTVLARFDGTPETAVEWQNTARPRDYASLAPLVIEAAKAGSAPAAALMDEAAHDVVRLLDGLAVTGAVEFCLMGGLAQPMLPWLPDTWTRRFQAPKGDALAGALHYVRQQVARPRVAEVH